MTVSEPAWVPTSCTLPTVEQPLRVAEFDALFSTGLRRVERLDRTRLRLTLDPAAERVARDLTARESQCCSFFTFTVTADDHDVRVAVTVPTTQTEVVDALQRRAAQALA